MKKGFTLIELLVVVLIIGILAAIALPQYTKAVEKSRVAEALLNNKNILDAMQRYVLAQGLPSTNTHGKAMVDNLDIDISGGSWDSDNSSLYTTKNFYYTMSCSSGGCGVSAFRSRGGQNIYMIEDSINSDGTFDKRCYTYETDIGQGICKQLVSNAYTTYDEEY
ncbi:prepilin-type N-terminal cleavage/methylation domain-containing protein [Elusimicrobium simillimum]|uniref:type IV pilin protein n=1 Tax=Elusimicrobium simillimum TaxID=3143438 RepID=UPI003C6FFC08